MIKVTIFAYLLVRITLIWENVKVEVIFGLGINTHAIGARYFENQPSKMSLFWFQEIFFRNLDFKTECKNELNDKTGKSAADQVRELPKNRFYTCLDSRVHSDNVGVKIQMTN